MSEQPIGVGMIGCGTVGGGVAELLHQQADVYAKRIGRSIQLRSILVRNPENARTTAGPWADTLTDDPERFFAAEDMPIVVEVAGGIDPIAGYVRRALEAGKHVVTANKSLLAAQGAELFSLAREHNASIAFEASCAGGVPVVTSLCFGLMANQVTALFGILNGTCNYILNEMTRSGKTYSEALGEAQAAGFAEADPTMDVSGQDTVQKLAILTSLAFGVLAKEDQVTCTGIDSIDLADIRFGLDLGYEMKLLAIAQRDPGSPGQRLVLSTEPCFIPSDQPLAQVHGSFNALSVYGDAVGHTMYLGRGAGKLPTASAVVSDLINVASGWYPEAFRKLNLWPDQHHPAQIQPPEETSSRYYLRINMLDAPGVLGAVSAILGDAEISLYSVLQHKVEQGVFVPVVITLHECNRGALHHALDQVEKLDEIGGRPVCIRILDTPAG